MFDKIKKLFGSSIDAQGESESVETNPEKSAITEEEINEVQLKISQLQEDLQVIENDHQLKAKTQENLGILFESINNIDEAINYYELSLENDLVFGKSYKNLLSLLNKKRAEAAKAKDNEKLQAYLEKIDSMRQLGKELTFKK